MDVAHSCGTVKECEVTATKQKDDTEGRDGGDHKVT